MITQLNHHVASKSWRPWRASWKSRPANGSPRQAWHERGCLGSCPVSSLSQQGANVRGLIDFIEDTVFGLTNRILQEEQGALSRCEKILVLVLGFAERNAGISRLMTGDVLTGETERLRTRIGQFYERLETQLKQVLREGELSKELACGDRVGAMANLLLAVIEGRIQQFVRSGFKRSPTQLWPAQWQLLRSALLNAA